MPRKRKSDGTNGAGDGPATKSLKVAKGEKLKDLDVQWEWEGDKHKWTVYDSDVGKELTDAYSKKKKKISVDVPGGVSFDILFDKMVQRNKKTGWERRIRLAISDDKEHIIWQWQDEHNNWNPYNVECTLELEQTRAAGNNTCDLEIMGRNYTIDLENMSQENCDTGVSRNVKRMKSDGEAPVDGGEGSAKMTVKEEPKEEEEEEEEPSASTSSGKSGRGKSKGKSAGKSGNKSGRSGSVKEENTMRTVVMKGKAPVDPECTSKVGVAHVYFEGKDIYDVMLNQTNLQFNNNKYYLIQLLEDDGRKSYSVWQRWGRVGKKGQNSLVPCGPDLDKAKAVFSKKFSDKTNNQWTNRMSFSKVAGKYDMVHLDYSNDGKSEDSVDSASTVQEDGPESKLDKKLQNLIQLICDVKAMEDAVIEMKFDTKKAPLGKLNPAQIKAGYSALKEIDALIDAGHTGSKLVQACNDFYTRIPHDFGMKVPPVIRTKPEVKAKIQLLEALGDIEIAMKIIKESVKDENPVDTHYNALKCKLEPLDKSDADYKMVEDYLKNTHASTHNQYKMKLLDVFAVNKDGEEENFLDVGNRTLLWHGSRLSNWVGILSQGLRIAPPEAPVTGYMFGKGVYFADMSSKSANYCFTSRAKNVGLVLLSEVSLGQTNDLLAADYGAAKLPKGKHSVKGLGRIAPDPKKSFTMADGTVVPLGKSHDTGISNPHGYTLNYNEYIVYNTRQVRMKYLLKVQFDFK